MFCKKCGTEIAGAMAFCPQCGTPTAPEPADDAQQRAAAFAAGQQGAPGAVVSQPQPMMATPVPTVGQTPVPMAGQTPVASAGQGTTPPVDAKAKRRRTRIIAGAISAVAVVAIAVCIGVWWKSDQDAKAAQAAAQAAWDKAHVSQVVNVPLEAPDFAADSTAVPVQVKGTNLDGNAVDEIQYLRADSRQVSVLQGAYDLTFPGGYFTSAGHVGKSSGATQHVDVRIVENPGTAAASGQQGGDGQESSDGAQGSSSGASAQEGAASDAGSQQISQYGSEGTLSVTDLEPVVYTIIPDVDVTDELISDVVKWASYDSSNQSRADQLKVTVVTNRDAAVAEKQRQEEEARKAAEEAERRATAEAAQAAAAAAEAEKRNFPANSNPKSDFSYDMGKGFSLEDVHLESTSNGKAILVGTLRNNSDSSIKTYWLLYECYVPKYEREFSFYSNGANIASCNIPRGSSMRVTMEYSQSSSSHPTSIDAADVEYFTHGGYKINR